MGPGSETQVKESRWRVQGPGSHFSGMPKLTLLLTLFPERNSAPSHIFKASLEEVIVLYSEKMKAKYMNEDV